MHKHEWDFTEMLGPGNPIRDGAVHPVRCQCGATARVKVEVPNGPPLGIGFSLRETDLQEPASGIEG